MGQSIDKIDKSCKIFTVSVGTTTDTSKRIYGSLQEAIDACSTNSTIILNGGKYYGKSKDKGCKGDIR